MHGLTGGRWRSGAHGETYTGAPDNRHPRGTRETEPVSLSARTASGLPHQLRRFWRSMLLGVGAAHLVAKTDFVVRYEHGDMDVWRKPVAVLFTMSKSIDFPLADSCIVQVFGTLWVVHLQREP